MIDSEIIKMPSVDKAKYYTKLVNRVLYDIKPSSILDVGGGAAPFNHVTHIIDQLPWRDDIHLNGWGYAPVMKKPIYSKDTYLQRNFFDLPWPYHDKQFDFIWCTQTLEDIYDPFIICNEMERIGKQGFIQTPNVFSEVLENFWHHK